MAISHEIQPSSIYQCREIRILGQMHAEAGKILFLPVDFRYG